MSGLVIALWEKLSFLSFQWTVFNNKAGFSKFLGRIEARINHRDSFAAVLWKWWRCLKYCILRQLLNQHDHIHWEEILGSQKRWMELLETSAWARSGVPYLGWILGDQRAWISPQIALHLWLAPIYFLKISSPNPVLSCLFSYCLRAWALFHIHNEVLSTGLTWNMLAMSSVIQLLGSFSQLQNPRVAGAVWKLRRKWGQDSEETTRKIRRGQDFSKESWQTNVLEFTVRSQVTLAKPVLLSAFWYFKGDHSF